MATQTITYSNKTDLNTTATADINKVKASDLNEIKSVVNNNATELSKLQGTILWTNPSPTNAFAGQPITLSSSDYDLLEIFYYNWTTQKLVNSVRAFKGENIIMQASIVNNGQGFIDIRAVAYTSDTSLTFGSSYSIIANSQISVAETNNRNVPIYVVGYKTGLF